MNGSNFRIETLENPAVRLINSYPLTACPRPSTRILTQFILFNFVHTALEYKDVWFKHYFPP